MRPGYNASTPETRKRLKDHYRECERITADWRQAHERWERENRRQVRITKRNIEVVNTLPEPKYPSLPPFPDECLYMTCGARNRKGLPCGNIDLYPNGRCKFHGGASTGPTSELGKWRSSVNGFLRKRKKRTP